MAQLTENEKKKFTIHGFGCMAVLGADLVLPGVFAIPLTEAAIETTIEQNPGHIITNQAEAKAIIASLNHKVEMLKGGETMDKTRALLLLGLLVLTEAPLAIPNIAPHLTEFSNGIPDWIPAVMAASTLVYALSALNMRSRLNALNKK